MKALRRDVLGVIGLGVLAALPGGATAQELANDAGVQAVNLLKGEDPTPPSVSSIVAPHGLGDVYAYYYIGSDDSRWYIDHTQSDWGQLKTVLPLLSESDFPTNPPGMTLVGDQDRGVPAWWDNDHWEWPSFVDDVLTQPQTVNGDEAETTIFNPSINSGSLLEGRTYDLDIFGHFDTTSSSEFFTLRIKVGGTTIATIQSTAANVNDAPFKATTVFSVEVQGASGQLESYTSATFANEDKDKPHGQSSIDTTTPTPIEVTVEWDGTDPANQLVADIGRLKQMG